jgi:hypothetical protein
VVAHPNDHPRSSDLIVERDGAVQGILPRQRASAITAIWCRPAYLAAPAFFAALEPGVRADMINDVLPRLIVSGRPSRSTTRRNICATSAARHGMLAERDLLDGGLRRSTSAARPAIFFDCDGVHNQEPGIRHRVAPAT